MLSRIHSSALTVALLVPFGLVAGCIIQEGTRDTSASTSDSSSSSVSSSSTTGGGEGGAGGAGGESGTGGAGGAGGAGGGAECVGPKGSGQTAASCNKMNITPTNSGGAASSTCEEDGGTAGNLDPPGYTFCKRAFAVYTEGTAENLQACLADISVAPAYACDPKLVSACNDKVHTEACSTEYTDTLCSDLGKSCEANFDKVKCAYYLKTWNDEALTDFGTCFNDPNKSGTCQEVFDDCYDMFRP